MPNNEYTGDTLEIGLYYNVEKYHEGTEAQNKAFHALLQEYWCSGCHSYNVTSFEQFKEVIKLYLGAGVEEYENFVSDTGKPLNKPITSYRIKSWSMYTKKERTSTIQNLISEMHQAGVSSKKFEEILRGLENGGEYARGNISVNFSCCN